MRYDIVAVGDLFADLIVHGRERPRFGQAEILAEGYEIDIGGSAPIFAAQAARLGGRVALVGRVGDDVLGRELRSRLAAFGIDVTRLNAVTGEKTPLGLNLAVGADRAMVTVLGALTRLTAAAIPDDVVAATRHWHIASYFLLAPLQPHWPAFARGLRARGVTISLDSNWAPAGDWERVRALLPLVDVFLPNENEALAIAGAADWRDAGAELARQCPLVVIKRGADGATAFARGRRIDASVPTDHTRGRFVDAVGAGDNFDAGFVWAWLNREAIEVCLDLAITCGTCSTRAPGGIQGQFQPTHQ